MYGEFELVRGVGWLLPWVMVPEIQQDGLASHMRPADVVQSETCQVLVVVGIVEGVVDVGWLFSSKIVQIAASVTARKV